MIQITPELSIDEAELHYDFIRATGPGGQNVNKVATGVQLRFNVLHSPSLSSEVRRRLQSLAGNRINQEGVLIITARQARSQYQNRRAATEQLIELLRRATHRPKKRHKTAPSKGARRRRMDAKRRRSETKQRRGPVQRDE